MRWGWLLWAACRTSTGDMAAPEPEAAPNVFLPSDPVAAASGPGASDAVGFVISGGEISATVAIGSQPTRLVLPVEMAALRFSDVTTLSFPVGFVKVDTANVSAPGHAELGAQVVRHWLRNDDGALIQVFFDLGSIGAATGRLTVGGAPVDAEILGAVQLDGRRDEIDGRVRFSRPAEDRLVMELTAPIELSLTPFDRTAYTATLAKALATTVGSSVTVDARVEWTRSDDDQLPNFMRTPVTVATVSEIRKRVDESVDRFELSQRRAAESGMDPALQGVVTRERLEDIRLETRKRAEQARPGSGR